MVARARRSPASLPRTAPARSCHGISSATSHRSRRSPAGTASRGRDSSTDIAGRTRTFCAAWRRASRSSAPEPDSPPPCGVTSSVSLASDRCPSAASVRSSFQARATAALLTGSALHAHFAPETATSGFFGWFFTCLGRDVGFAIPEGGAGQLTEAHRQGRLRRPGRGAGRAGGAGLPATRQATACDGARATSSAATRTSWAARSPAGRRSFTSSCVPAGSLARTSRDVHASLFAASASIHPGDGVHGGPAQARRWWRSPPRAGGSPWPRQAQRRRRPRVWR